MADSFLMDLVDVVVNRDGVWETPETEMGVRGGPPATDLEKAEGRRPPWGALRRSSVEPFMVVSDPSLSLSSLA